MPTPNPLEPQIRLLRNARREAWIVLAVWALFLVWSVGYSYVFGYQHPPGSWIVEIGLARQRDAASYASVAGIPDWVFFGIVLPWCLATLFTAYFGLVILRRDALADDAGESPAGDGAGASG